MFDYEEIERTLHDNNLPLQRIDFRAKDELLEQLYTRFIEGNPRALWESLKYIPTRIDCGMDDPYWHLLDVIDANAILYFIIDYWNTDFVVFKGRMADIHIFIGDCDGLDEFYLLSPDFQELYCITDHDDLYYINAGKSTPRAPRF